MLYLKHIPFVNTANYTLGKSGTPARSLITVMQPTKINRVAILGQDPSAMEPEESSFLQTSFDAKRGRLIILYIHATSMA
jgi:hypothetical protein